jgi:phosphoribosylamine-glycine ligase
MENHLMPFIEKKDVDYAITNMEKAIDALKQETGTAYKGFLYGQFMKTRKGIKLVEFNARFGDPETQVVLPRLQTDLAEVLLACAEGLLAEMELSWSYDVAVSVVVASAGYPGDYETGKVIEGVEEAERVRGVRVYHAGTKRTDGGAAVTAGGRVLNVTALAPDFETAIDSAYRAASNIAFDGAFYRNDIGQRALRPRA